MSGLTDQTKFYDVRPDSPTPFIRSKSMKPSHILITKIVLLLILSLLPLGGIAADDKPNSPLKKQDKREPDTSDPQSAVTIYVMIEDPTKKIIIERKITLHQSQTWESVYNSEFDRITKQELLGIKPVGDRFLACVYFIDDGNGTKISITKHFRIVDGRVIISKGNTPKILDLFPEKSDLGQ